MKAYCYRSGQIRFGGRTPRGAILFAEATPEGECLLRGIVSVLARHAYDGKTLLVPGVPEAVDAEAALAALHRFQDEVRERLRKRKETARA